MKRRRDSYARCKRTLDKVFSEWVRRKAIGRDGLVGCCSCGARLPWRVIQAGHWVSRVYLATRWNERNVNPQCMACNVWRRGNASGYAQYMLATHGVEVMQELEELKHSTVKYRASDLQEMIESYKARLGELG